MINRLINMNVYPMPTKQIEPTIINRGVYTTEDYARTFINGLSENQKSRFKKMLENGIKCGQSVADNYQIDYDEFINEVKKQMGV